MPADAWTIPRVIARWRRIDPEVQALVSDDDAITWAGLDDASLALARRLVRAGVSKGDRVGLLLPNGIEWATVGAFPSGCSEWEGANRSRCVRREKNSPAM